MGGKVRGVIMEVWWKGLGIGAADFITLQSREMFYLQRYLCTIPSSNLSKTFFYPLPPPFRPSLIKPSRPSHQHSPTPPSGPPLTPFPATSPALPASPQTLPRPDRPDSAS